MLVILSFLHGRGVEGLEANLRYLFSIGLMNDDNDDDDDDDDDDEEEEEEGQNKRFMFINKAYLKDAVELGGPPS